MKHGGFYSGPDRFNPGHLIEHKFEDATTVDKNAWAHRRNIRLDDVKSIDELISNVVSIVSCNGNILINVGPTKEGTIIPIFEERLRQLGGWLKMNGEAIYGSRPWNYQNDSLPSNTQVRYTSKDDTLYGIVLGWPAQSELFLGDVKASSSTKILLLGYTHPLLFSNMEDGTLKITFPSMDELIGKCGKFCHWAYTLEITNAAPRVSNVNLITIN